MSEPFASRQRALCRVVEAALGLDIPYPFRPTFSGRPAAVLILCGIRERGGAPEILVTRRTEHLDTHKGQYALPGGMCDSDEESLPDTALRETEEEVGIKSGAIEIFGNLPPLWTPSGFLVTPVVGVLTKPIEEVVVTPNAAEIDIWFWCELDRLRGPGAYSTEAYTATQNGEPHSVMVDVYQIDEHRIWGATGAMLRNFILRLETLERAPHFG